MAGPTRNQEFKFNSVQPGGQVRGPEGPTARTCGAVLLLLLLPARASLAAEAKTIIDRAYQLTSSARTPDDYSQIITWCGQAEREVLTTEQTTYIRSLLAWTYNRRGEAFAELAAEAHRQGRAEEARKLDTTALADFEASLSYDKRKWKSWHNRAVSRAVSGKYEDAISDFSQVVALKPDYANAWFNRAEILYDLGRFDEAIRDYSEAIKLDGMDAGAYSSRAHAYFSLGRMESAIADYTQAVKLAPDNPHLLANRGDAYQSLGKWIEAAEDLKAALQIGGDSPRVLQSAAWLMATCPESELRNADYAVQAAEKAVNLAEQSGQSIDFRFLDTLAAAYANANRFDEAVVRVTAAIQQAPTDQAPALTKRKDLYLRKQPYRQPPGEKTAAARKTKAPR